MRACRLPVSLSASNTCSGRPRSWEIRLVASTRAEMDFMPTAFSRSCTHLGAGPFFTPRISRPAKIGQASLFSGVKVQRDGFGRGEFARHRLTVLGLQRAQARPRPDRARCRNTLAASPRLGVMETSITGSLQQPDAPARDRRADLGVGRQLDDAVMIFAQQQVRGPSTSCRAIPRRGWCRSSALRRVAGMTVPGRASTTLMPARALGAPQTICSGCPRRH